MITESLQTSKHISPEEKIEFPDIERYYHYYQDTNERDKSSPDLQYGVSCHNSSIVSSNGKIQLLCCFYFSVEHFLFRTRAETFLCYIVNCSVAYF